MKLLLQAIKSLIRKLENAVEEIANYFGADAIIKQLHLPRDYPYFSQGVVLPETYVEANQGFDICTAYLDKRLNLVPGAKYTVAVNDYEFSCMAVAGEFWGSEGVALYREDLVDEGLIVVIFESPGLELETGKPVTIFGYFDDFTLSIKGLKYTPISERYLPESIRDLADVLGIIKEKHLPEGYPYTSYGEIIPETYFTFTEDEKDGDLYFKDLGTPLHLIPDCEYEVYNSGPSYTCVARELIVEGVRVVIVGEASYFGFESTGENFIIIDVRSDVNDESVHSIIVSINNNYMNLSMRGPTLKKIDERYLPDYAKKNVHGFIKQEHLPKGYPYMGGEILPSTTIEIDTMDFNLGIIPTHFFLTPGNQYTVTWNGTEYVCTAQEYTSDGATTIAIGNIEGNTAEPFSMARITADTGVDDALVGQWMVVAHDDSASATISIVEGEITKMDVKYLPEEVALKSDLEGLSGNSSSDMAWLPAVSEEGVISWSRSSTTTAPESKNIKGPTGERGTGLLPITTAPSSYTTTVNGLTPAYRIALDTVKTQAGVTEVFAGDTLRYSYYHYPVIYVDSSYVYCRTRVSIRGAAGAAGTGIQSITLQGQDANGGNVYAVLLTDETSYTITAPKGDTGSPATATTLPESGTALTANTIYNVADVVGTYAFTAPESGWAHGEFTTDSNASVSFAGRFLGAVPDVEASKTYEFDVLNGSWVVQEVITV